MYNNYEPNVKATLTFIKLLKVKVNGLTVNETLQNHPDWETLLSVCDSINKWNIPNAAAKTDVSNIDQLPTPFIACTKNLEKPLAVISRVTETEIEAYQRNYSKPTIYPKAEFIKTWDGVFLIAEPNLHSGEENYVVNRRKAIFNSFIPSTLIVCLIIFSFYLLSKVTRVSSLPITAFYMQYFILFVGFIVTSLLLWYEMDKSNPLLQKVCTGIAKGNCNAILTGKHSKVFSWLSWSEVGFFYFAGSLLVMLSSPALIGRDSEVSAGLITNAGLILTAWLNILALPYTVFSVYYQCRVAKQRCVLCLAVQGLLLLGGINVITNDFLLPVPQFPFLFIANCILLFALPALLWYVVQPSILKLQEAKNTKREYLRIKFNTEIFNTLLNRQKAITKSTDGLGIDIGNPAATNTIIKVCSPTIGPCGKAHPKIEELIEQNNNVKAKIIFTTLNDQSHHGIKPTRHLMAIASETGNDVKIKKSLDDWYLPEKKGYELFAAKYPMNGELLEQGKKIEAMDKWCKAMDIQATSTIFINGYQLPDAYSIEDLQYFLLE